MPGDIEYGWNLYIRVEELHKIFNKKKKNINYLTAYYAQRNAV